MINLLLTVPEYTQEHNKESFVFTVVNPAFAGSMRGIKILQQIIPMSTSTVEVKNFSLCKEMSVEAKLQDIKY